MWSILDSFFGGIGSAISDVTDWLYSLVAVVFGWLYQLIENVVQFVLQLFGAVARFFDWLWQTMIATAISTIWNVLKSFVGWLEAKLLPIVQFLLKLRAMIARYFNIYVRPFLILIQKIRQYLQILSLLHIGIATKLDNFLAQIQGRITQAYATVIGTINAVIDVVNAIADPSYLLRKPALLLSIRRQLPALIRAVTGHPPGYWFPSPRGSKGGPFAPIGLPFNFQQYAAANPTSNFLSTDDGIGDPGSYFDGLMFTDGDANQAQMLDYFNDDLYPANMCPQNPAACLYASLGVNNG